MIVYEYASAVAYPGFQRGGCLRSGPIRKVGGCSSLQVRYEKWGGGGGGVQFTSDPIRKVGGEGGGPGAVRFRSDTKSGGLGLAHSKYVIVNKLTVTILAEGGAQAPGAPSLDTPLQVNLHHWCDAPYLGNNTPVNRLGNIRPVNIIGVSQLL